MKTQFEHRVILSVIKMDGRFSEDEIATFRRQAHGRTLDNMSYFFKADNKQSEILHFVEFYEVRKLPLLKRIYHYIRKFIATIASYIGMSKCIIMP